MFSLAGASTWFMQKKPAKPEASVFRLIIRKHDVSPNLALSSEEGSWWSRSVTTGWYRSLRSQLDTGARIAVAVIPSGCIAGSSTGDALAND